MRAAGSHMRPPQDEEPTMTNVARVLIIDDDEDFRASVRSVLEAEGYTVTTASTGRSGLDAVRQERPDLIVLDVMMESTTEGYAVSHAVKFGPEATDIPIIMVSSIEASPDELFPRSDEVALIRPDHYLTKPLDIPRFLQLVGAAVARRTHA
jgi:CheY-like chemotaxis protein